MRCSSEGGPEEFPTLRELEQAVIDLAVQVRRERVFPTPPEPGEDLKPEPDEEDS